MTWVKICGITNLQDASIAVEAGADALGFVFYEKSPRNIDREVAREIVQQLPEGVEKVGVFVGNYSDDWLDLIRNVGLTATQIHIEPHLGTVSDNKAYGAGAFPPGFKSYLSLSAEWFIENQEGAVSFIENIERAREFMQSGREQSSFDTRPTIFLDSGTLQQPGGTGTAFDWQKAATIVEYMKRTVRVIVAGGLSPNNVGEAIRILKPWGVDVSSGVEAKPGKKDPEKVRAFVSAVRGAGA